MLLLMIAFVVDSKERVCVKSMSNECAMRTHHRFNEREAIIHHGGAPENAKLTERALCLFLKCASYGIHHLFFVPHHLLLLDLSWKEKMPATQKQRKQKWQRK